MCSQRRILRLVISGQNFGGALYGLIADSNLLLILSPFACFSGFSFQGLGLIAMFSMSCWNELFYVEYHILYTQYIVYKLQRGKDLRDLPFPRAVHLMNSVQTETQISFSCKNTAYSDFILTLTPFCQFCGNTVDLTRFTAVIFYLNFARVCIHSSISLNFLNINC